ncbi:MAG: NAD-dependent epimerase/dehydratase family protein, partial [Planctomycetales bacterium]|nr:NAD-dependent epimerase/dehydratase family protein [Planctomycetales bacterium]
MKVLVTGATGLLGNNVVRQLVERGDEVTVLVRASSDSRPLAELPVHRVVGDVTDEESVKRAAADVDAIIHTAAHIHIGWTQWETGRRVNVEGSRNVARAARERGVRLVYVSTVDTFGVGTIDEPADETSPREGKPNCCYVATKREAEQAVQQMVAEGLDAVIVNPGFMLGPWDWKPSSGRMLLEVATRAPFATPSGGCSVCDSRDVASGILSAIERGQAGRNYILAGENIRYFELWSLMSEVTGRRPPVFRMRAVAPFIGGTAGDFWTKVSGREPTLNSALVRMSRLTHYYSSQRAIDELGYSPRPPRESITAAWQWFQQHGYVHHVADAA